MNERIQNEATTRIAELIFIIMQPAIAGGISEKEAEIIYNKILSNICKLHESQSQFNILLEDILNKWALPIIKEHGVSIDLPQQFSLN
ncbi:MAG: hypothetical protein WC223_13805 [Bacteroidales bacterium]|jgi:hypothetical protein